MQDSSILMNVSATVPQTIYKFIYIANNTILYLNLAAGKHFHEKNVNFLILEANDYIGGRVKNIEWNGISIPLGAGWFHGVDENPLLVEKAKKFNLSSYKDSYKSDNIVFRYVY